MDLPQQEISKRIRLQLKRRRLTLEACCKAFNSRYSRDIESGFVRPLNKDFLSRVSRGRFKVSSERVSKLCEYLEVGEFDELGETLKVLSRELEEFGRQSEVSAEFRAKFPTIRKFLIGLNLQGLVDGPD